MSRTRQKNATAIMPALICGIGGLGVQIQLTCPRIPQNDGIGGHGVTIKYPLGESNPSRSYGETPCMFLGDSSFDGIRYLCAPNPNNPGWKLPESAKDKTLADTDDTGGNTHNKRMLT